MQEGGDEIDCHEVGFYEDYEDDQVLEVGIRGLDCADGDRSFSIQWSTYGPDDQDIESGMDSYNISSEQGITVYGCLRRVHLSDSLLTLEFENEDAQILEISNPVEIELAGVAAQASNLGVKLAQVLDWGSTGKRPEMIGLGGA